MKICKTLWYIKYFRRGYPLIFQDPGILVRIKNFYFDWRNNRCQTYNVSGRLLQLLLWESYASDFFTFKTKKNVVLKNSLKSPIAFTKLRWRKTVCGVTLVKNSLTKTNDFFTANSRVGNYNTDQQLALFTRSLQFFT